MSYWGKYGNLSSVELAKWSLQDIANHVDQDYFYRVDDTTLPIAERYELIRLHRTVIGLQQVIELNGGSQPATWIPLLFDKQTYRPGGLR